MGRTERNGQDGSLRIAGRYRLVDQLGAGGMSVVWRGHDEVLGRPVAVKVLSPRLANDQAFRDRLRQEALAAARLVHPHITGIFDFGECPLADQVTVPYVVMELNDGESVAARIARQGALAWWEAVTIAAEVASALATAHARGLVHRDVTPANVMLTGTGAKVVDFGISAAVGQRDAAPDGSLLGTPAYLAPERLGGAHVSAATDVYALGLLLYRGLTGRLPWPAETTAEALRAHLYAEPEPLPAQPDMPDQVAALCLRCLAKRPEDRPDAAHVARALAAAVGAQAVIPPVAAGDDTRSRAPVALGRAALGYLGLPGGTPDSHPAAATRRLRAGLRFGSVLRMGAVQPLGGGLFAGGRRMPFARRSVSGRSVRRQPLWMHRAPAAGVALAVLAVGLLTWSNGRDAPTVEQAQAAGSAAATVPQGTICAVRYQLRRDSGSDYDAQLTVATTDAVALGWRVQFLYPGTQRLTAGPAAVTQRGRKVVVRGHGKLRMFTLRGDYRGVNALPFSFTLNGHRCRAEVLGSVTPWRGDGGDDAVSEAAGSGDRASDRDGIAPPDRSNRTSRKFSRVASGTHSLRDG